MSCPNCDSTDVFEFHDKVWSAEDSVVLRCRNCELIFIDPMMTIEEEREFYENYNQHVKARGMTATQSVEEFHEKSLPIAKQRLEVVGSYFESGKKVLEVGSSTGAFLSLIKNCNTYACELAHDNRDYSKQFVTGGTFASLESIKDQTFDIICMFHVFEHIRDPQMFLSQCLVCLNEGGIILIEVPCSEDPLVTVFELEEYKDFIFQPMHPMVYNEEALDFVFNQAGFSKERVIYHQRYGLANHLAWLKNKRPGGDEMMNELFVDITAYSKKLEQLKKTDTIFYVAKKRV